MKREEEKESVRRKKRRERDIYSCPLLPFIPINKAKSKGRGKRRERERHSCLYFSLDHLYL